MFEILQYICGYSSDKRTKEKSNKNKYICIDGDMWWADFWELMTYKFQLFYQIFWFDLEIVWLYNTSVTDHYKKSRLLLAFLLYCRGMAVTKY